MAKKIVEAHGGAITAITGDKESGIRLVIWLPKDIRDLATQMFSA